MRRTSFYILCAVYATDYTLLLFLMIIGLAVFTPAELDFKHPPGQASRLVVEAAFPYKYSFLLRTFTFFSSYLEQHRL